MNELRITTVQTELFWESPENNLKMLDKKLLQLADTDLIILPEMFTTAFSMKSEKLAENMHGASMQWLKKQASEKKCAITGSLIIRENGKFYNRLIFMQADGSFFYYDKRHLFRMAHEDSYYSAGNKLLQIDYRGWKIQPFICYDLRFPVWSRNSMQSDILLYVANWPAKRREVWKTLLKARAIENQAFTVGVNRVGEDNLGNMYAGDSGIAKPSGELASGFFTENSIETTTLYKQELQDFRKKFPAHLDADKFSIKCVPEM